MTGRQKLKLKQETAHEMELVLDTLHNTLEALEEYIGKTYHYSDWDSKRQIYRKTIKDSNDTLEGFEDLFLTQLFIVKASVKNKPEFFLKEVQKEFHKWINAVGIDVNNCPEKLKHFLFEINEVLEGRGDNIVNQTKELIKDKELTTNEALGFFSQLQNPLNKNRDRGDLIKDRNWDEAENKNKIDGNFEQGNKAFSQISQNIASRHGNYDLFSEQKKVRGVQDNNPQQLTNSQIIQDVKDNSQNWRIDEIVIGYDLDKEKEEKVLIHNSAQIDYDVMGNLKFAGNLIYRAERFSPEEIKEINQALNISQSSVNQGIRQEIINDFGQSRFKKVRVNFRENNYYEDWLVRDSVNVGSSITFDPKNMYKVNDLTEAEKKAIGYKSEVGLQTNFSTTPKNNDKSIGKGGIIAIIGISVLLIGGVVVVKKQLNKKVKK